MARTKAAPPPVSKTVQRLLAQIHAEAEAATLEALSARDGIVVLDPMPLDGRRVVARGSRSFRFECDDGSSLHFQITHEHVDFGLVGPGPRWMAFQTLRDGQGRKWETILGCNFITDDFGNLVDAEGGAA